MTATRLAVALIGALFLKAALATDFACLTGSSLYERVPKVCNMDMPVKNPFGIDESPEEWFCSVTKVTEMGMVDARMPPYIWSCATANQCNATCTLPAGASENSVMDCAGYYGEDGNGVVLSDKAGIVAKTWCAPALNNAKKPNKLSWLKGAALPPALVLDLPFYDLERPAKNAGSANRQVSLFVVAGVSFVTGVALRFL